MARTPDRPEVPPPAVGGVLPRAGEAFGVRVKLATYSLDVALISTAGGPPRLVSAYIDS